MEKDLRQNIILIGFMGSGKTSVGKVLAEQLSYPFYDTDLLIEEKAGITIKEIFRIQGEESFRKLETDLLIDLKSSLKSVVLSTGGGLPIKEQNAKLLKEIGQVIYLKAKKETIVERLIGDTNRPLLDGDDSNRKVEQLLAIRSPIYEKAADLIIETDGKTIDEIITDIRKELENE